MGWVAGRLAAVEVVIFTIYFQAGAHRTCVESERKRRAKVCACSEVSSGERELTTGGTGWGGGGGRQKSLLAFETLTKQCRQRSLEVKQGVLSFGGENE